MQTIDVVQVGLGPLGRKITQFIAQRPCIRIVGAVDLAPDICGRDLGELCGLDRSDVTIKDSVARVLADTRPQAVILTTVSSLASLTPQVEEIVSYGVPVVSTCEELSYPWETAPELAARIDAAARSQRVAVLGTGVNPGFVMDVWPTFLTAVCQEVHSVKISRIQNAAFRRLPFQQKIGAGLSLEAFEDKKQAGTLRHVGLTESIQMIAGRLGWKLTRVEDEISPVVAQTEIVTAAMTIAPGFAAGVEQMGRGYVAGQERISMRFHAAVGASISEDTIEIQGLPDIKSTIPGGINGDVATCAITLNSLGQVIKAPAGLRTMVDIPVVSFFE
jgi:2,4-diaminopentanoate dehydrogenase